MLNQVRTPPTKDDLLITSLYSGNATNVAKRCTTCVCIASSLPAMIKPRSRDGDFETLFADFADNQYQQKQLPGHGCLNVRACI